MNPRGMEERLRWVRRATTGRSFVAASARVAAASLAALLAAVGLDALRPMPAWALALISLGWLGALGVGVARSAWRSIRACPNLRATARLIETRAEVPHNRVINALLFSRGAPAPTGGALEAVLIARAVERGGVGLEAASESAVLAPEVAAATRWLAALLIAALMVVGGVATLPRVFSAVLPRFAEPFADHPAYSPTDFHLTIDPAEPSLGEDVEVRVRTSGRQPRSLRLIVRGRESAAHPLPLALTPALKPGEASLFTATLSDLRTPLRVHAEGDTGRSRAITIVPATIPRIIEAAATITPPGYTGRAAVTQALGVGATVHSLQALVGSEIELHLGATVRLAAQGVVVAPVGAGLTPRINAFGRSLSARIGAVTDRPFDIDLRPVSEGGVPAAQSVRVSVAPQLDEPPTLRLLKPAWSGDDLLAPAQATLLFDAEARDDLGLRVLGLAYSVFDARGVWRSFGTVMRASHDQSPIFTARDDIVKLAPRLPLPRLGAEPGGSLVITLLAVDTRVEPFGEPQRAAVGPIVIRLADSGGASCGGQCDGWIQMPTGGDSKPNKNGDYQPNDTWDSDTPPDQQGEDSGQGRSTRPSAPDDQDASSPSGSAPDAADEWIFADPILTAADAPRAASPASQRRAGRSQREASDAPPDPLRRVPDAYRDVVTRYFRLLNETPGHNDTLP